MSCACANSIVFPIWGHTHPSPILDTAPKPHFFVCFSVGFHVVNHEPTLSPWLTMAGTVPQESGHPNSKMRQEPGELEAKPKPSQWWGLVCSLDTTYYASGIIWKICLYHDSYIGIVLVTVETWNLGPNWRVGAELAVTSEVQGAYGASRTPSFKWDCAIYGLHHTTSPRLC